MILIPFITRIISFIILIMILIMLVRKITIEMMIFSHKTITPITTTAAIVISILI